MEKDSGLTWCKWEHPYKEDIDVWHDRPRRVKLDSARLQILIWIELYKKSEA